MGLSMDKEFRRYPRATIKWPVTIRTEKGIMAGEITDISPDGLFIRCQDPLEENEVFKIAFYIHAVADTAVATAKVVWAYKCLPDEKRSKCGMGVRLLSIPDIDRSYIIHEIIDQLKSTDDDPELSWSIIS